MLTAERLKAVLDYSPLTGEFSWRVTLSPRAIKGRKAGYVHSNGYMYVKVDGVSYLAHRLAFLYTHSKWPDNDVDHGNRIRYDNRQDNLSDVTKAENNRNRRWTIHI